jgi:hypothetical protein
LPPVELDGIFDTALIEPLLIISIVLHQRLLNCIHLLEP